MSLNCNELDVILNELDLTGSFVQDIVQPGYDSIALYTYKTASAKVILFCLAPGSCRMNETKKRIPKNDKPLRFNEFLRSRIRGAKIISCRQIQKDRIVEIKLEREGKIFILPAATEKLKKVADKKASQEEAAAADNGVESYTLYIRLWSNAANIFLCDGSNTILDSFYRRPAKKEMTGEHFELPAPKQDGDERDWPVRTFDEIQTAHTQQHPEEEPLSFNEKTDRWYSEHAASTSLESLLDQAQKWHESHKSRQQAALDRLREKRESFANAAQWKHQGDLILSFGYQIDGTANFLECTDYETGKLIRIKIDPKKNAQENAAVYYDTYKKETGGIADLDHDIALAEKELAELESLYGAMTREQNPLRLEQMLRRDSKPKQQEKKTHPGLGCEIDGWTILVGRDANENDELLRHYVKGPDLWLHTRDFAGGYVFVKARAGKTAPLDILLYAGNLAVYHSKARKNGTADLYYTQVKFLRRAKNGPKGLVLPTHEKNLRISLDDDKLKRLDELMKNQ
jgi:predicted ribosome quality control (RQC) complex YloA/Tae2 family protein